MAKKPTHKIRIGRVIASIWERDGEAGTRYFVTFEHFFASEQGWSYSDCFSGEDLLSLAKAGDMAHTWITRRRNDAKQAA